MWLLSNWIITLLKYSLYSSSYSASYPTASWISNRFVIFLIVVKSHSSLLSLTKHNAICPGWKHLFFVLHKNHWLLIVSLFLQNRSIGWYFPLYWLNLIFIFFSSVWENLSKSCKTFSCCFISYNIRYFYQNDLHFIVFCKNFFDIFLSRVLGLPLRSILFLFVYNGVCIKSFYFVFFCKCFGIIIGQMFWDYHRLSILLELLIYFWK